MGGTNPNAKKGAEHKYNSLEENYIYSKYQQGYPNFEVQDVQPYTQASFNDFNGISDDRGHAQLLDGVFSFARTCGIVTITILDPSGNLVLIDIDTAVTQEYKGRVIAINLGTEGSSFGWEFNGWLCELIGNIQELADLSDLEFRIFVGSSYPAPVAMTAPYNLTAISNCFKLADDKLAVIDNLNCQFSIDLAALGDGDGGFLSFDAAFAALISKVDLGALTCNSVAFINIPGSEVWRVNCLFNNAGAGAAVCDWAIDVGVICQRAAGSDNISAFSNFVCTNATWTGDIVFNAFMGNPATPGPTDTRGSIAALAMNRASTPVTITFGVTATIDEYTIAGLGLGFSGDASGSTNGTMDTTLTPGDAFTNPFVTVVIDDFAVDNIIEFDAMIGASYPVSTPLGAAYNLQPVTGGVVKSGNNRLLIGSNTTVIAEITVDRIPSNPGATTFTTPNTGQCLQLFRSLSGAAVTMVSVTVPNAALAPCIIRFQLAGLALDDSNTCTWAEHVAVSFGTNSADLSLSAWQLRNGTADIAAVFTTVSNATVQGYIRGLAWVLRRTPGNGTERFIGSNANAVLGGRCDHNGASAGIGSVAALAPPGTIVSGVTSVPAVTGFIVPVVAISLTLI